MHAISRLATVFVRVVAISAATAACSPAFAQPYPSRPIEMIAPISPGGGMDQQARVLAKLVEPELGQPVVVMNRPGAGGTIGVGALTRAKPDGYTIAAVWNGPLTVSPQTQTVPYTLDDYIPVIQFSKAPFVLCAQPDFPAANSREFIANVRQNPGKYTYGHEGTGGILHLAVERAFGALGLSMMGVPFPGATDTARNFMGEHITFYAGGITSILAQSRTGKAKCLLLTSGADNPAFPQATGLDALGVGNAATVFWRSIIVPKGTPPDIIAKLESAFRKAAQSPKFLEYLEGLGEAPATASGPELAAELRSEYAAIGALWKKLSAK